jgi:hypothetical protein
MYPSIGTQLLAQDLQIADLNVKLDQMMRAHVAGQMS